MPNLKTINNYFENQETSLWEGCDPRTEVERDYSASKFMDYTLFKRLLDTLPCTQSQFIHKVGVSPQAVSAWKRGGNISVYSERCILFAAEFFRSKLVTQKVPTLNHYTLEEVIENINSRGYDVSITSRA